MGDVIITRRMNQPTFVLICHPNLYPNGHLAFYVRSPTTLNHNCYFHRLEDPPRGHHRLRAQLSIGTSCEEFEVEEELCCLNPTYLHSLLLILSSSCLLLTQRIAGHFCRRRGVPLGEAARLGMISSSVPVAVFCFWRAAPRTPGERTTKSCSRA
jgi:hypothetical protein